LDQNKTIIELSKNNQTITPTKKKNETKRIKNKLLNFI